MDRSVEEHLGLSVWRQYWQLFDQAGTLVALIVVALGAVGFRVWAQEWVGFYLLAVLALLVLPFVAVLQLLRERTGELRDLLFAPLISVSAGPAVVLHRSGPPASLIRLSVRNDSGRAVSLTAKVTDTHGWPGPEVPWPVPWRHGSGVAHRLFPGDSEMLDVAEVQNGVICGYVRDGDGNDVARAEAAASGAAVIGVTIWDVDSGQVAAAVVVELTDPVAEPGAFSVARLSVDRVV